MLRRAARFLLRRRPAPPPPVAPVPALRLWVDELAEAGVTAREWAQRRMSRDAVYVSVGEGTLKRLHQEHPALVRATIDAATRLLRHEFNLLGSGPYVPVDPDRHPDETGYQPIDWHLDPVSGLRFPPGVPLADWVFEQRRPGLADVKMPWELSRCQHWVVLGQAYQLTGDNRFALEIAHQLRDFMIGNPIATGVNWSCTMDVGLRAVSWTIALDLIRSCSSLTPAFWDEAYQALFEHGTFIERHLEVNFGVTSNHFLSNVLGLFFIAAVFDDLPRGQLWDQECRTWLQQEMAIQVYADGSDFESSIPYHRLVTELFLVAARLADYRGAPLPDDLRRRIAGMVEFFAAVQRPDGLMPQVGDADDGRVQILTGYGTAPPQDGRHLFGPASCVLGRPEWSALGGEHVQWETAWWGFDVPPPVAAGSPPVDGIRLFRQAGLAVMRRGRDYLLVTNGIVGTEGFGNHKHNDLLGFEYHVDGAPLFVDPGSYVYMCNPEARNLFRSTRSHNTLAIDGEEQNEMVPESLFRLFEKANPVTIEAGEKGDSLRYRGRHRGYTRLAQPVVHERTFTLDRRNGDLTIDDLLTGSGVHRLRWHFHFAPGVEVALADNGSFVLRLGASLLDLVTPAGLQHSLGPAWYSPSYGVRIPCLALDLEIEETLRRKRRFTWRIARR